MEKTVDEYKNEFIDVFKKNIKREGSEALLDYLLNHSDFFLAPASGRRHSAFEGGLCSHSLNTYKRFKNNIIQEYGDNYSEKISDESIAIISLLHDLCKVNTYTVDYRNQKVEGQWIHSLNKRRSNGNQLAHGRI